MHEYSNLKSILGPPLFPGIGDVISDRLLYHYNGHDLISEIKKPDGGNLLRIPGVGNTILKTLQRGVDVGKALVELALFLDENDFNQPVVRKVFALWGPNALEKIHARPHRLLTVAGWDEVDKFSRAFGPEFHPCRMIAAVEWCMYDDYENDKNTCISPLDLRRKISKLLRCNTQTAIKAIRYAIEVGAIVEYLEHYQLPAVYQLERWLERYLESNSRSDINDDAICNFLKEARHLKLNSRQLCAVENALKFKIVAIHGRGGRGKTYVLTTIVEAAEKILGCTAILAAVSAKACQQIYKQTGIKAHTIARLIHVLKPETFANSILIIDEASMVSLNEAYQVLKKLPSSSHVVFLGDHNQATSVEAGRFFYDIISQKTVPVVELVKNMKQDHKTDQQLEMILKGKFPVFDEYQVKPSTGLFRKNFSKKFRPIDQDALDHFAEEFSIKSSIKVFFEMLMAHTDETVQIITPKNSTSIEINSRVHMELFRTENYCKGTPVIWNKNKYVKDGLRITNGSMGKVSKIIEGHPEYSLEIIFESEEYGLVRLTATEVDKYLEKAYCITIHKAQGSSWDNVIVALPNAPMIDRNLIYSALSRCRKRAVAAYLDHGFIASRIKARSSFKNRKSLFLRGINVQKNLH